MGDKVGYFDVMIVGKTVGTTVGSIEGNTVVVGTDVGDDEG